MPMPAQRPGTSRQDYETPDEVLRAVKRRLSIGDFKVDLAATEQNAICGLWFDDSFKESWHTFGGWCWCNPPFGTITPWVQKAWEESLLGAKVAVLIPASVGSNWWRDWVHEKAHVLFMNGRVKFVGATDMYPKDTALLLYQKSTRGGYEIWDWRAE